MKNVIHEKPTNNISLGVLGHIIVVNKQVHSYQMDALSSYVNALGVNIEDTVLADIIDGKDGAVSIKDSIEALSQESESVRCDICFMLLVLSRLDNVVDEKEDSLISEVFLKMSFSDEQINYLNEMASENADRFRKNQNSLFENEFMSKENKIPKTSKKKKHIDDQDYVEIIKKCERIAKEDFGVVHPCYRTIIAQNQKCLKAIDSFESAFAGENELSEKVEELVKVFSDAVREKVVCQTEIADNLLEQKERTLPDFTITFLGRTKAGKSTLHAILTKTGYDKIGVGRQRTTRYNRVYQWNLIRLIDTPGIGSAEADGRSDDEIAESVLGESDVICIVVADDSILKDILDLMDKAAKYNKPIILLLNHKENIRNEIKYKRFIANPTKWAENSGESNLQGHIDRIKKYAEIQGYQDLVKPYKVFLLAARMASEVESLSDRKILWSNSGVEPFIRDLKEMIAYFGTIKRSQTIIDEAVQKIGELNLELKKAKQPIDDHIIDLEKLREKTIKSLKQERDATAKRIKNVILEKGAEIAEEKSQVFARELYENCKISELSAAQEKWDKFIDETGIKQELIESINNEINKYVKKSDSTIEELFDDISYSIVNEYHISGVAIPINIDFKRIFTICNFIIASEAIALGVLTIFFPFLAIVEAIVMAKWLLVDVSTALAKNRYEKKEAYIRRVHKAIKRKITRASKKQAREGSRVAKEEIDKQIAKIDNIFDDLIGGLRFLSSQASVMERTYTAQNEWLNKVFAWRIVQFLKNREEKYSFESVNDTIEGVYRVNKTIYIGTSMKNRAKTDRLKDVLADKIEFV